MVVFVVGRHRSGTSMVAGILHALGVVMTDRRFVPGEANPAGNYEDQDFSGLLKQTMRNWKEARGASVENCRVEMQEYLRQKQRKHDNWGLKQPRVCYLLDDVVAMIDDEVKLIVTRRDLHVSVRSLRRCFTSLDEATAYRVSADCDAALSEQRSYRTLPRLMVRYEDVVGCACRWLFVSMIARFVGLPLRAEAVAAIHPELNRCGGH